MGDPMKVKWSTEDDGGVTADLLLTCQPDGSITLASHDGSFSEKYESRTQAQEAIATLFEYGMQQIGSAR